MIGKDKIFTTLEKVIANSKADQTEAVFLGSSVGLTRFANSHIHQNVAESNTRVFFRSAIDGKVGTASTNSLKQEDLLRTMKNSLEIARLLPANPNFKGFPRPAKYKKISTFFEPTAKYTPKQRAEVIKKIAR